MNFLESVQVAMNAIWVNKMRSLLTMLGIIIGISSVITVVTLGQGSQSAIDKEFEQFGTGRAYIGTNWRETLTQKDYLTTSDIEALKNAFGDKFDAIIQSLEESGKIKSKNEIIKVSLVGGNENYDKIEKVNMINGRYLTNSDVKAKRSVAIIDNETSMDIFGRSNVLGENIMVDMGYTKTSFVIVGLYEEPKSNLGNMGGGEKTPKIFVPVSTLAKVRGMGEHIWGIDLSIKKGIDANSTIEKMIKLLERRHGNDGENKYRSYTAEGEMESVNKVTGVITAVVSAIAAISLVVGGIGVMNIMLVSVTERTREIGIRKAIGAKRKDILLQFLVESIIVSGIGGVIGTLLGIGISIIIANFIKIPPSVSISTIAIAWIFSAGVGVFFGIYPANKASKLDPIEALRYE
ncbi:ABC transporter permease [Marinisporobacter balticus]|uniref:Putative ABC transport system permease protein n=1 Tax=Marinisporobacter balticus TaxID=2018667 RepID=A0A4R2KUE2_9FIRM|nr:ABC transporter permease [Marinisporobacter balticus]TCO76427.1 putative ABC transport system permease protein [Marinisporobacter balticus]